MRRRHRDTGILTTVEVARLLAQPQTDTAVGIRDRAAIEAAYACGLWSREMRLLDLPDVDLRKNEVLVRGARRRRIPLVEAARPALHQYVEEGRPKLLHRGNGAAAFLLSTSGTRLGHVNLWTIVEQAKASAGIHRPGAFALLRNSLAAHLFAAGLTIAAIMEIFGIRCAAHWGGVRDRKDLIDAIQRLHPRGQMNVGEAGQS